MRTPIFVYALIAISGFATGWFAFDRQPFWHKTAKPNFLLIMTDDQSWLHTSYTGYPAVSTPNFDRIAREGVYFENAYASAPTCTASRSATLTGQHFWRLGSAGLLWGEFPANLKTYQQILAEHGYKIGYTGKGWGPGKSVRGNPAGPDYNRIKSGADPNLSQENHVENFRQFLQEKQPGQAFSFWLTPSEPHRPYRKDFGAESGAIDLQKIEIPSFLPDDPAIRKDIADYLYEIQWFDRELGEVLQVLKDAGELDNTVIVYTSDNGMPFPRAKSNNYEYGTHVPLAVRWGNGISIHQQVTDFISLTDLAPTFLDIAGIAIPAEMTGKSFRDQLLANRSGRIEKRRNAAFSGFERHIGNARLNNSSYPSRAIHSDNYLLIENLAPDRWPAGRPPSLADIDDGSPSKNTLVLHKSEHEKYWSLAAEKRPPQELYNIEKDTGQIYNLADDPEYKPIKDALAKRLREKLLKTGDPCAIGDCDIFDNYIYYGAPQE